MKEYNREKKILEEPQEKTGSLKTRKLCRGGKPHRYQLSLPAHLLGHDDISPEGIEEYYKSEQRIADFLDNESTILKGYGINRKWGFGIRKVVKYYKCEVCLKRDTEY